jgi:DNA repair protein RecO
VADCTADAVVLRRVPWGENDRLLHLFTSEMGVVTVVAKGARKAGSRLASATDPLSFGRYTFAQGRVRAYLRHVDRAEGWPAIRHDFGRLSAAFALLEMVDKSLPMGSPAPEVYAWLLAALAGLEAGDDWRPAYVWAAARLLEIEGQAPQWRSATPGPLWVSPAAGGQVPDGAQGKYGDAVRCSEECTIALDKVSELGAPPPRIRPADECAAVLSRYWSALLGTRTPALDALAGMVSGA